MRIYLDNAATTPMDEAVIAAMQPYMLQTYGNPSSLHHFGREAKVAVDNAREQVADLLNVNPGSIFFTASGTEADNWALQSAIQTLPATKHVITSPIEHHAVLHPLEALATREEIEELHFVALDEVGNIDYNHLESLLQKYGPSLVSLMHGNNEVGNLTDIEKVGNLCKQYQAFFHSDTVQTIGHYRLDLDELPLDLCVGSAHKFHGPKGVGFLYINEETPIPPMILGGAQERGIRAGTENVAGIVGLAKAFQIAHNKMDERRQYIESLKKRMIDQLKRQISGIEFNGTSAHIDQSLYTILSVSLPPSDDVEMYLLNLDIKGIAASSGSACTSGSTKPSHVLTALQSDPKRAAIRFSFSHLNQPEEIDYTVQELAKLM